MGHLADHRLWQVFDELNASWLLVAGELRLAEGDDLLGRDRMSGPEDHEGGDLLTPDRIVHSHDGTFGHRGMREDRFLHLTRVDVLPAGDDHVVLAADEKDEAVLVDDAHVAGVQPSVPETLGRQFWVLPVAEHD